MKNHAKSSHVSFGAGSWRKWWRNEVYSWGGVADMSKTTPKYQDIGRKIYKTPWKITLNVLVCHLRLDHREIGGY